MPLSVETASFTGKAESNVTMDASLSSWASAGSFTLGTMIQGVKISKIASPRSLVRCRPSVLGARPPAASTPSVKSLLLAVRFGA